MLEAVIDAPLQHRSLTVFPVVAPKGPSLRFLLSTEIHGSEVLTIRERGDETTPMLLVRNNSFHDLLVLGGEPLPGESAGRLVSRSFLLKGKSVTQVLASSMERGNWTRPDEDAEVTEWLRQFPIQRHQIGVMAFQGSRLLGMEALGSPDLYRPLHRRLLIRFLRNVLSDQAAAISPERDEGELLEAARRFVDALEEAERWETRRVGMGDYWVLEGTVSGGELIHQGNLVHLSAHPMAEGAFRQSEEGG